MRLDKAPSATGGVVGEYTYKSDFLVRRTLFAWLIADGDMHLKNLSVLKIGHKGRKSFDAVRMAPIYDVVSTRVFPGLQHDWLALKLNGKDVGLRRADFLSLAANAGLRRSDAESVIDEMLDRLKNSIQIIKLPANVVYPQTFDSTAKDVLNITGLRIDQFA